MVVAAPAGAQDPTTAITEDPASGAVYAGHHEPALVTRRVDGTESWRVTLPTGPVLTMAVHAQSGDLYVLTAGALTRMRASNGTVAGSLPLNGLPVGALAVDRFGAVFLGGDGFLSKLNGKDWSTLFVSDPDGSVVALAVDRAGTAYAALSVGDDAVIGKLAADGTWDFRVTLGQRPRPRSSGMRARCMSPAPRRRPTSRPIAPGKPG